nr:squalene synthase HpnC [uncultured Rhodoferax sp.]
MAPMPSPLPAAPATAAPITHYENFPVASWLCPPHLRTPIAAIYHFARTADDIADEGDASPAQRLASLQAYRQALQQAADGETAFANWPQVFGPLQVAIQQHALPVQLLHDLLDAFVQDIEKTRDAAGYADDAELLDYCRRSANPVGRLLLHLYGVHGTQALAESDAICTALQLINFWQDLSVDIPRGRYYLSDAARARFGVPQADILARRQTPDATKLIAACAYAARASMLKGSQLVHRLPGRAGWELRLVVQGGLRILDKIAALDYTTLTQRPVLRAWDFPLLLWRAARM